MGIEVRRVGAALVRQVATHQHGTDPRLGDAVEAFHNVLHPRCQLAREGARHGGRQVFAAGDKVRLIGGAVVDAVRSCRIRLVHPSLTQTIYLP